MRSNMRKTVHWATAVILAHTVVSAVHGVAHLRVGVEIFPTRFHVLFIIGVITLAPLLAMILLWTPGRRAGAWLLVGSMTASLLFGAYYHYMTQGPDHFSQIPSGAWGMLFHGTAVLLVITEALGCWVGVLALKQPGRA